MAHVWKHLAPKFEQIDRLDRKFFTDLCGVLHKILDIMGINLQVRRSHFSCTSAAVSRPALIYRGLLKNIEQ